MNIMLIGHSGSGKDCIHSLLPGYHRIALADPIRTIVSILRDRGVGAAFAYSTGLLGEHTPDDLMYILRFYSQIPRTSKEKSLLQGIGTYFVSCKDDIWINQAITAIQGDNNIITDIRRHSEFNTFKSMGFHSIYVECREDLRIQRLTMRDGEYNASSARHPAETEVTSLKELCDSVVVNESSLEELRINVESVVNHRQS